MQQFINPATADWETILKRPTASFKDLEPLVEEVFQEVKAKGDQALDDYTLKFDKVKLNSFAVSVEEYARAEKAVTDPLKAAIQLARENIKTFHTAQQTQTVSVETYLKLRLGSGPTPATPFSANKVRIECRIARACGRTGSSKTGIGISPPLSTT